MPKFYFDIYDGQTDFKDEGGIDMAQADLATEARSLLRLLARHIRRDGAGWVASVA